MVYHSFRKILSKSGIVLVSLIMVFATSCISESEEELFPELSLCDTLDINYSSDIEPILQNRCYSCHSTSSNLSGILLDNYENLSAKAENGKLLGAIKHEDGYIPMPADGGQLEECDINKIEAWINQGMIDK